jgi:hypothetical protein
MIDTFLLCFALVAVTAVCAVAARRLRVPYSIVLVITGIALAFVPGRASSSRGPSAQASASEATMYTLIYVTSMISACGLLAYFRPKVG